MNNIILVVLLAAGTFGIDQAPLHQPLLDPAISHRAGDMEVLLDRVESLSTREQIELYLGQGRRHRKGTSFSAGVRRIENDPALRRFAAVESDWLFAAGGVGAVPSARRLVELKVMVTRNLHFRDIEPTSAAVAAELAQIRRDRHRLASLPLFADRTVVYAVSEERLEDGRRVYGRAPTRHFLEEQAARLVFVDGAAEKADLDRRLLETRRLTFAFEGHGNGRSLKLDSALSAKRLAGILAARPAASPSPIIILDTCFAHDFARRLAREMTRLGTKAAMPILVVPDEVGQKLIKEVFAAGFLRFDVSARAVHDTTLGALMSAPARRISIYAPDSRNVLRQIS